MSLSERFAAAQHAAPPAAPAPTTPQAPPPPGLRSRARAAAPEDGPQPTTLPTARATKVDPLARLKSEASTLLYQRLGARLTNPDIDEAELRAMVVAELDGIVAESSTSLTPAEQRLVKEAVQAQVLGLGVLEPFLADHTVTEVMVNGPDHIYVERAGKLSRTSASFASEQDLRRVIDRVVSRIGRRIDEASPLVDARLEDGSRVNAVIPPLAVSGSSLTIRKFSRDVLSVDDMIGLGTLSHEAATVLAACVRARLNVIVSGGTGSGKTSLLNVLSSFIPADERIVTIEDTVELQLQQEHVVRLEARPANSEGRGEITIRDLVRNSLRMRPDRIIVGEARDAEALDMLQAMNTGHDGSLSTVHSNSPRDTLARLETLVMMAGIELPLKAVREQISSAVDLIVHLSRLRDGTRRVVNITEVLGMEGPTVTLQDVFAFDFSQGVDRDGRFRGHLKPTGVRPRFLDRLDDLGIVLPPTIFAETGGRGGR